MTHKEIEDYLLSFPGAWLDFPFGEGTSVYKTTQNSDDGKIFAIIADNSQPLRLSLKCDPALSLTLREKYETVMPGYHLNKKHWNTILCTGQVSNEDLKSLMHLSYSLASGTKVVN